MVLLVAGLVVLACHLVDRYQRTHVRIDPARLELWAAWTARQVASAASGRQVIGHRTAAEIRRFGFRGVSERLWRDRDARLEAIRRRQGRTVVPIRRIAS